MLLLLRGQQYALNQRGAVSEQPPAQITTPNPFSFTAVTDAALSTQYVSDAVTLTGINADAPISIVGGEYQINGGSWTSLSGSYPVGASLKARLLSSASEGTLTAAIITVGGVSAAFNVTTEAEEVATPGYYNFTGSNLSIYAAAKAATMAGISNTRILCAGDSITAGAYAGSYPPNGITTAWPSQCADILNLAGVNTSTSSVFADHNISGLSLPSSALESFDPRIAYGSGWSSYPGIPTIGGPIFRCEPDFSGSLDFTFDNACDRFEIYDITSSGFAYGTLAYAVDGGANIATMGQEATNSFRKTSFNVTLGTHTVNIKRPSGSYIHFCGIIGWNSAVKEIQMINAGAASWGTTAWNDNAQPWSPRPAITAVAPHLTICVENANDIATSLPLSTYATQLQAKITAGKVTGDVLLVAEHHVAPSVADYETQQAYVDKMYELALANDCPMVDLWRLMGTYETLNGAGKMGDTVHPNPIGLADYASRISVPLIDPMMVSAATP